MQKQLLHFFLSQLLINYSEIIIQCNTIQSKNKKKKEEKKQYKAEINKERKKEIT